jgi:hypothetical protein
MEEKTGDVGTPVNPESFFTDETSDSTVQQPQPTDVNAPTEQTPEVPVWNGEEWTFKAAGKQWTPKDRSELMKWASFGVNYDTKARALNQQRAELLRMRKEIEDAKEAKADPASTKEEDVSSLFSNQDSDVTKKLAELEQRISRVDSYALMQESKAMDVTLTEGMDALQKEIEMTPEEVDELYLELGGRVRSLPDEAIDSSDKIKRLLKNLYFELHPDAIDEIVEKRATAKADQVKKSLGAKIKVEGSAPSAPTGKPRPTDFLDAQRQLEDAWDTLPK